LSWPEVVILMNLFSFQDRIISTAREDAFHVAAFFRSEGSSSVRRQNSTAFVPNSVFWQSEKGVMRNKLWLIAQIANFVVANDRWSETVVSKTVWYIVERRKWVQNHSWS
jgi:hypothetical protein